MGGHADSCQAALFQEIDFVGQCRNVGEVKRSRFFTPSSLEFRESTHKGREARFMILTVEPRPVPSLKRSHHRKIKEASVRTTLKTNTPMTLWLATLG
jgi:hypothetical protein